MTITIPVTPVPKGRPRFGKNGAVFTDRKTEAAEKILGFYLKRHFKEPLEGPLAVDIVFVVVRPKTNRRTLPDIKPDLDNLAKLVLDAGNGICWKDDAQICDLFLHKRYGPVAGIIVKLSTAF